MSHHPSLLWPWTAYVVAFLVLSLGLPALVSCSDSAAEPRSQATRTPPSKSSSSPAPSTAEEQTWGAPQQIADRRLERDLPSGVVRVRGGASTAVWVVPRSRRNATPARVEVSERRGSGEWTPPQVIAALARGFVEKVAVALGPRHLAAVAWTRNVGGRDSLMVNLRENGRWGRPKVLGEGEAGSVVIDGHGVITVAGLRTHTYPGKPFVARRVHGHWEPIQVMAQDGGIPELAVNRRGDLAMVWPTLEGVGVSTRRHGTCCWETTDLRSPFSYIEVARVAIDANGRALAVWALDEDDAAPRRKHLAWSRSFSDGTWTQTRYLDEQIKDAVYYDWLHLSMNSQGAAVAVWSGGGTRAARFAFDQGWTQPTTLPGSIYRSMMTTSGTAVAVLADGNGACTWMFQKPHSGRWRPGGPVPTGEQWDSPGNAQPGEPGEPSGSAPSGEPMDAHGSGQSMVLLYYDRPSLGSSYLDAPVLQGP